MAGTGRKQRRSRYVEIGVVVDDAADRFAAQNAILDELRRRPEVVELYSAWLGRFGIRDVAGRAIKDLPDDPAARSEWRGRWIRPLGAALRTDLRRQILYIEAWFLDHRLPPRLAGDLHLIFYHEVMAATLGVAGFGEVGGCVAGCRPNRVGPLPADLCETLPA